MTQLRKSRPCSAGVGFPTLTLVAPGIKNARRWRVCDLINMMVVEDSLRPGNQGEQSGTNSGKRWSARRWIREELTATSASEEATVSLVETVGQVGLTPPTQC